MKASRWMVVAPAVALLLSVSPAPSRATELNYRDWSEGGLGMIVQSIAYEEAHVYSLGPIGDTDFMQLAMLIAADADVEDGGEKNAVLIECGMHGREWFASESCYWLVDHLLQERNRAWMQELLAHTDIWIVPQSNPAGRDLDDPGWGDPTEFTYVCDDGGNAGNVCTGDADCPGGLCYLKGWRTNANTDACELGVDLARNFSTGWNQAIGLCTTDVCVGGTNAGNGCASAADCPPNGRCDNARMFYRGPAPFSEHESLNLRRFVHNHMISMAAIVHANAQQIWNPWYGNAATRYMTDQLVTLNDLASDLYPGRGDPDPTMLLDSVGSGSGQFSAWLTGRSNVVGELDEGTERNVSTFYFELPVTASNYEDPFENRVGDGSNSFHPSDVEMRALWRRAIRDLLLYVARQARSPQCPVDGTGARIVSECPADDFGIVGAKIADATNLPGLLDYDPDTREETLPFGTRRIVFAVQNFSSSASSTSSNVTVSVYKNGVLDGAAHVEAIALLPGERSVASVTHFFSPGATYRVELELDGDGFVSNDRKSFAFRVPGLVAQGRLVQLGSAHLRATRGDLPAEGRLAYRGKFLMTETLHPESFGLALTVQAHPPRGPNVIQDPPALVYQLPSGSPWWDGSKPEKGRWVYRDPDGNAGPVTTLRITQQASKTKPELVTRVAMRTKDHFLAPLSGARSYVVSLDVPGAAVRLTSLARGLKPILPPRVLEPEDETEDEPAQ